MNSATCDWILGATSAHCGAPAFVYVEYMCVHEHLRAGHECSDHSGDPVICGACAEGSEAHACDLRELSRVAS